MHSPDRILRTIFGQSWTLLRYGFDPGMMSLSFVVCFGIPIIRLRTMKGQDVPCFMWVRDLSHFVCYCCKILNNMMLCVKIMLIYII